MASSPPVSPLGPPQRPLSGMIRPPRSSSRLSTSSKQGGSSRASDEDVKTSVKVAVRVRPPLKSTDPGFDLIPRRFQRSMIHVTTPTSLTVDSPQGRKLFVFDRVFGEEVYQENVWEYLSESVNAFIQGYNVSVLAYGQSGAGKSYTMGTSGPTEQSDPRLMGVIPRAASALFEKLSGPPILNRTGSGIRTPTRYSTNSVQTLQSLAKSGGDKNWQMNATYIEIYNEQLRDLLVPEHVPYTERSAVTIREDSKGRILLTGLHQVTINSAEDLLEALNYGSMVRQTDATAINEKSSRSHAVFSLNLVQRKNKSQQPSAQERRYSVPVESMISADNWVTMDSKLHFVDLAGSERLKNTGAFGERAKEGISINAGLASLGKVISQLSSRQAGSHVSYRDSKLTRLLQDSLGGNAITYMIACVTPAEFHLSETLNTIQYAQRARAIQSKPRIQQVSDEGDKQALIDRLRAEIMFLREQISNSERSDRLSGNPQERIERQNEREIELQNHLLDIQENYTALSQRHAKLISEITKSKDDELTQPPKVNGVGGESAVERLKRSNSFAEAVEQVVLEYEKTIQSLETSLSNTRSSLSTTESSLLERETKCAYVETVNQQLQTRIQKLVDRESITEKYLHDLEARLDGSSFGDEKNSAVVTELRKEISRVRENEGRCEEYISTLEERLAEADQDMELMQREIGRLEHVVERQRSVGKLDSLLYELDHAQSNGKPSDDIHMTNGVFDKKSSLSRSNGLPRSTLKEAMETPIPESDEEDWQISSIASPEARRGDISETYAQSPTRSKFVNDKLQTVTQELFNLRLEHESTANEYDLLSGKYEEALRTITELQKSTDESRRSSLLSVVSPRKLGPTYFLEDARVRELKDAGQLSSSRSLSSELSLAGESPTTSDHSSTDLSKQLTEPGDESQRAKTDDSAPEMGSLKTLHNEAEKGMNTLHTKYIQLQEQHMDTLDLVEELKAEIQKVRLSAPISPISQAIRRKSSQNIMTIDRAHRSLASLGNIAAENFEDKPDTMQNFELNLNTAMHELHQRSERVQVLEAELSSVKKEMEIKGTIISGLTRERSSLKSSSPIDISVVSSMSNQLLQSENQIKMLHEKYVNKERELMDEIKSLQKSLSSHNKKNQISLSETPPLETEEFESQQFNRELPNASNGQAFSLQKELLQLETKHSAAIESMQASERKLLATISELENSLTEVENMRREKSSEFEIRSNKLYAATAELETERSKQAEIIKSLNTQINNQKAEIDSHVEKIKGLNESHINAREEIEAGIRVRETTQEQLHLYRNQIEDLEKQLTEHQSAVEFHKYGLKSLHDSQSRALEDIRSSTLRDAEAKAEVRLNELSMKHEEHIVKLSADVDIRKQELQNQIAGLEASIVGREHELEERDNLIEHLRHDNHESITTWNTVAEDLEDARNRLTAAEEAKALTEQSLAELQDTVDNLYKTQEDLKIQMENLRQREQRASRLVEELEGQLSSTFETTRITSSRLSTLQSTRDAELLEARAATAKAQEEIEVLSTRLEQIEMQRGSTVIHIDGSNDRSNSISSTLRKSSATGLPSPPPAIPLPPLPTSIPNQVTNNSSSINLATSPSEATHSSRELITSQMVQDQEARIMTIEKHLHAEKQLTATLEDALVELEATGLKLKVDAEIWRKKARSYEDELINLRNERNSNRFSLQAVEEERSARKEAEAAKAHLEERMAALNKRKKKSNFNCF